MVSPDAFLNLCHEINPKNSRCGSGSVVSSRSRWRCQGPFGVFRQSSVMATCRCPFTRPRWVACCPQTRRQGFCFGGHRWGLLKKFRGLPTMGHSFLISAWRFIWNGQGTLFPWNHRYPHAIWRTKALGALVQGTRLSEFKLRMLLVTGDVLQNDPL